MLDIEAHQKGGGGYNGKTLAERLAGRFYTPVQLANDLAKQMIFALDVGSLSNVAVTDPFCGDGRLVVALLSAASMRPELTKLRWFVELRDREAEAAAQAGERVDAAASLLGMSVETRVIVGDTFKCDLSPRFDLVITNPPWELLKPDSRELKHLSPDKAEQYKANLKDASKQLDHRFPDARAGNAWGGWGTNLARCGWDLSLSIARSGGVVGVILPATIMGDQSSTKMRRKAFGLNRLVDAAVYPAEARLFERVDQPVVALTMRSGGGACGDGRIRSFSSDRVQSGEQLIKLDRQAMEVRGWTIPVGRPSGADELMGKFINLPTLQEWEGEGASDLWLGRELDETRIVEKVTAGDQYPFIKGRMIQRHEVVEAPTMSVRPTLCASFHSANKPRAVWRDVARATSKRRMIGTVIPPGWIAGNSLHVACYRDGDSKRTAALHALLSSFVVEAQVRSRLTTGHMSLGVVRQARVPVLHCGLVERLSPLADRAMNGGCASAEYRLEISVAKAFGFNREDFARLLDDFPKLDHVERQALTNAEVWNDSTL